MAAKQRVETFHNKYRKKEDAIAGSMTKHGTTKHRKAKT